MCTSVLLLCVITTKSDKLITFLDVTFMSACTNYDMCHGTGMVVKGETILNSVTMWQCDGSLCKIKTLWPFITDSKESNTLWLFEMFAIQTMVYFAHRSAFSFLGMRLREEGHFYPMYKWSKPLPATLIRLARVKCKCETHRIQACARCLPKQHKLI